MAGVTSTVPAWQASSGRHATWFCVFEKVPASHAAHARSETVEPETLTREPGSQVVHDAHVGALADTLNAPLGQLRQLRSESAVPSLPTRWPGTHTVQGKHSVAALTSSSQVPSAQGSMDAEPPRQ